MAQYNIVTQYVGTDWVATTTKDTQLQTEYNNSLSLWGGVKPTQAKLNFELVWVC